MAVSDSKEVVIEASRDDIVGVIADMASSPEWNSAQQSVEVIDTGEDGLPHQVKMKVKTAGMGDELLVEYTWADDVVSSTLISSKQLKMQDAKYTFTPEGEKTRVKFELTVDPSVPIPGFVLKRAMKGAMNDNTDGLRKRVLKVKKSG